ncbi:WD repeat-containing protein 97-like [Venturia canescens]|uniref:WD repeat-containing protein 97-like n=1 Tax=Venturia canescens TaxID=32260 RepID=UPI001C9D5C8D|nr:WD repeat-containing protein 97-like [Venturia canescens]
MSLRSDIVIEGSAQFVNKRLGVTTSGITALLYHRTSQWIITGDQQGNVCGWSLNLDCTMSCSNGHDSQIKLIIRHPSICGFLTVCNEDILQVWSCNLREKMESFSEIGEISSIAINESATSLATLGSKLNCFIMNQLYVFYAPLTASATNLSSTTNPTFPTRVIATSCDNTTRILSSAKGRQINVQILSPKLDVIAASYSGITNRMYTIILKTGEILVSSVKSKPMKLKHVWVSDERTITRVIVYESFEKIIPIEGSEEIKINPVSALIIAGTSNGELVVFEETSGKHNTRVAAHDGQIIDLSSSRITRQLVSVGQDRCVKVWRIFPDLTSPLVLTCTVYHVIPITRAAMIRFTICLISSTAVTKDHRVIMYDSSERTRMDHHRLKEHSDLITSIATLESLEICATSSLDKTIRIWNEANELIKILFINTASQHIVFSSLRGDIVLSAGKHLYRIPSENYLSPEHRIRINVEKIPEELDDIVILEDVGYRVYEDQLDRETLLHPVSSTPFGSLDTENSEALKLQIMMLEQMTLNLRYKEEDILKIKEGEIKGTRLVGNKSIMSRDAWDKHMDELLETSKQTDMEESPDTVFRSVKIYPGKRVYNQPEIFRMIHGYSMLSLDIHVEDLQSMMKAAKLPRSGFTPNSLIYKIEDLPEEEEIELVVEKEKFKYQYPPEILYGDSKEDSHENYDIRWTLSQIAELEAFEDREIDE